MYLRLLKVCTLHFFYCDRHTQNEYAVSTLKTNDTTQDQQHQSYNTYKDPSISSPVTESILSSGNVGFKLKRVDKRSNPQKEEASDGQIIDFKARLRKVENAEKEKSLEEKSTVTEQSSESEEQQDDKRRSTGSISSLKKLWENKESCESQPHSPKLSVRGGSGKQETLDQTEDSPEDHSGASTRSQRYIYWVVRKTLLILKPERIFRRTQCNIYFVPDSLKSLMYVYTI